jgi:hypothetical protein
VITRRVFASEEKAILLIGEHDGMVRLGSMGDNDALFEMSAEDAMAIADGLREKALKIIAGRPQEDDSVLP